MPQVHIGMLLACVKLDVNTQTKRWATLKMIFSEANKIVQSIVRMAVATQNIKMKESLSPHLITLDFRRIMSMVLICASL